MKKRNRENKHSLRVEGLTRRVFLRDYLKQKSLENIRDFWRSSSGQMMDQNLADLANFLSPLFSHSKITNEGLQGKKNQSKNQHKNQKKSIVRQVKKPLNSVSQPPEKTMQRAGNLKSAGIRKKKR